MPTPIFLSPILILRYFTEKLEKTRQVLKESVFPCFYNKISNILAWPMLNSLHGNILLEFINNFFECKFRISNQYIK